MKSYRRSQAKIYSLTSDSPVKHQFPHRAWKGFQQRLIHVKAERTTEGHAGGKVSRKGGCSLTSEQHINRLNRCDIPIKSVAISLFSLTHSSRALMFCRRLCKRKDKWWQLRGKNLTRVKWKSAWWVFLNEQHEFFHLYADRSLIAVLFFLLWGWRISFKNVHFWSTNALKTVDLF